MGKLSIYNNVEVEPSTTFEELEPQDVFMLYNSSVDIYMKLKVPEFSINSSEKIVVSPSPSAVNLAKGTIIFSVDDKTPVIPVDAYLEILNFDKEYE